MCRLLFIVPPEVEAGDHEFKACPNCWRPCSKRTERAGTVVPSVECSPTYLGHTRSWGLETQHCITQVGLHTHTHVIPELRSGRPAWTNETVFQINTKACEDTSSVFALHSTCLFSFSLLLSRQPIGEASSEQ